MNFFFRNYESSPTSSNCIINSLLAQNLLSCLEWHSATNNDKWDRILKSSGGLAQCSPSFASSLPWSSSEPPLSSSWSSPSWQGPQQSPCKARARRRVGWTSVRRRSRPPARWSCVVRSWTNNSLALVNTEIFDKLLSLKKSNLCIPLTVNWLGHPLVWQLMQLLWNGLRSAANTWARGAEGACRRSGQGDEQENLWTYCNIDEIHDIDEGGNSWSRG